MARPSKYEEWKKNNELKEKLFLIAGWSRNGLTQQQIADNLGINVDTLFEYKKKHAEFSEALKHGKEIADLQIENALFKAAKEGNITAQIFWLKNRKPDKWREQRREQEQQETPVININFAKASENIEEND